MEEEWIERRLDGKVERMGGEEGGEAGWYVKINENNVI